MEVLKNTIKIPRDNHANTVRREHQNAFKSNLTEKTDPYYDLLKETRTESPYERSIKEVKGNSNLPSITERSMNQQRGSKS